MHIKFTPVDASRVPIGSFNSTYQASTSNPEKPVYLGTPGVVGSYMARFEKMWAAAREE